MSVLDGVLGGIIGGEMTSVVNGLIEKHGGVKGLMNQFEQQGFGSTIKSWIGTGENQPISPDQVHKVVGDSTLKDLAAKAGMTPEQLASRLSEILPKAVDHMTPNGTLPQ